MEVNGVAHIHLTVSEFARSAAFYSELCAFLGMREVFSNEKYLYYVGGRTGVAIGEAAPEFKHDSFAQNRVGLHHVCFRARSREDVDAVHAYLKSKNIKIVHAPEDGAWAPGYYSVLFEDPDGIRLEVNHVPGKGVFADDAEFVPHGYT